MNQFYADFCGLTMTAFVFFRATVQMLIEQVQVTVTEQAIWQSF